MELNHKIYKWILTNQASSITRSTMKMSLIKVWTELIRSKFKEVHNILNNRLIKKFILTLDHIYRYLIRDNINPIARVQCQTCFNLREEAVTMRLIIVIQMDKTQRWEIWDSAHFKLIVLSLRPRNDLVTQWVGVREDSWVQMPKKEEIKNRTITKMNNINLQTIPTIWSTREMQCILMEMEISMRTAMEISIRMAMEINTRMAMEINTLMAMEISKLSKCTISKSTYNKINSSKQLIGKINMRIWWVCQ